MKSKIPRIMGVVLAVMLLASVFVCAAPASAGSLFWTGVNIPLAATNQLVAANADVGPVAFSPNYATDKTVFAAVNDVVGLTAPIVYRSTDGGYTWIATSSVLGGGLAGAIVVDLEVSPNYAADRTVFVATADSTAPGASNSFVYRSTDGGATFGQLGIVTTAGAEVITCMSVSPTYDGVGEIAVGIGDVRTGVAAPATTNVQVWGANGVLSWTASGTGLVDGIARDVTAISYSPNYAIDATMLAVTSAAGAVPILRDNVGGVWNTISATGVNVGAAVTTIDYDAQVVAVNDWNLSLADIALPSDYNGTTPTLRRAYVSIVGENGAAWGANFNVYRIDNVTAGIALNPGVALWDLDYSGTYAAGTLMGGLVTAAAGAVDVYYSSTAMTTTPIWYPATNAPTGTTIAALIPAAGAPVGLNMTSSARIDIASDFATSNLVCAGTPGTGSAFAISTNAGVNYNERGLIDNGGAALTFVAGSQIVLSPAYATDNTMFMISTNLGAAPNDTNVWRTTNGGTNWDRVMTGNFATAGVGVIAISKEYATDGVLYVGDTTTVNIFYSNSRGDGWAPRTINAAIGVTVADMAAPNGTILYVADSLGGNVAKSLNSGWVWTGANCKATGSGGNLISIAIDGDTVVVGDNGGNVYRSADANTTWAQVGTTILALNNVYVAVKGNQVYAQLSGNGDIYRWDVGTSAVWYCPDAVPLLGLGIAISADNTLYALDPSVGGVNNIRRSIDPTLGPAAPWPTFAWVAGAPAVAGVSMDVAPVTGSGNTLMLLTGTQLWTYTDILSAGSTPPTLLSPADGYTMENTDQATYSVQNVAGVTSWNLIFSNDSTFINGIDLTNFQVPPSTQVFVDISANTVGVSNELPIYWMARANLPLIGPWSVSRVVNAQPEIGVNAPAPAALATNLEGRASITPVFSWGSFKSATGYQIQVCKAGSEFDFSGENLIVDEILGPMTSYALTTPLEYDSAYAWRVRGLTAAGASDWSGAVGFRTEEAPVTPTPTPTPTYTISIPAQPTPTYTINVPPATPAPTTGVTPNWIYAIIVVGAVLVIAVIVLIVRTRRAA